MAAGVAPSRRDVLLGGCVLALAGCAARAGRASGGRSTPLVYDELGGLFVDARVAGRAGRFVLDTGASRSLLARGTAVELGLALRPGAPVEGTAGAVESEEATATLELPGIAPLRIDFVVYPFASYDAACVGILGHEVLSREPFRLRYGERRLAWSPAVPAHVVPLVLDGGIPRVEARVNGRALDFRIDTGATLAPSPEVYVNLAPRQAELLGLDGPPAKVFTATGTGGATLELPVHRLERFELGPRSFDDAYAIVQPPVGYFARPEAVGFLGSSVLDDLDPYLDYASGVLALDA